MTLRLALCFLFHQPLGERAAWAGRIGYRGVLAVLRNHPRMKFNLMLSGTLLDALCWFDDSLLRTVRCGVEEGQFRLIGSTYAQNLIPAGEDWDNARQIGLHRRTLKKYFGVEPSAFWSPQRAWRAGTAGAVRRGGYRVLPLEAATLRAAGAADPFVHRHPADGGALDLLWDDPALRTQFTYAAWFRKEQALRATLAGWTARPDSERLFPVCSQDAAAFGLWGYDAGLDPRADFQGLDRLLDFIGREGELETAFLEDAPEPVRELGSIPDGWSRELVRALADPEAPLHEEGYADWPDFLSRAPRIQHFRRIYGAARARLLGVEAGISRAEPPAPAAGTALFDLAAQVYCAHQVEFGAAGVGGRGDPAWEGVGAAITVAKAVELACAPAGSACRGLIDDVTGDGEDEILLRSGDSLAVLSPYGGRLLHWFDLRNGSQHVGNPLGVPVGTLLVEARAPEMASLPDDWLPAEREPIRGEIAEPAPGRRCALLDGAFLPGCADPLPVWPRPQRADLRPSLPARRRALNDFLSIDGGPEQPPEPRLDFRLAKGAVTFLRFFGYRLRMTKRMRWTDAGLRVLYRFRNADSQAMHLRLRTVSELCPDYQRLLDLPGRALEPLRFGPRAQPGVRNLRTDRALVCHASRTPSEPVVFRPGVLAWEVEQTFSFPVGPGETGMLILRLNLYDAGRLSSGQPAALKNGRASGGG